MTAFYIKPQRVNESELKLFVINLKELTELWNQFILIENVNLIRPTFGTWQSLENVKNTIVKSFNLKFCRKSPGQSIQCYFRIEPSESKQMFSWS